VTALGRYVRLEATGLWREGAGAPAREVIVAFGATTLILRDLDETPLGHWALAGLRARRRDGAAVVYATNADGAETLTIADPEMNAAIASVAGRAVPASVADGRRRSRAAALLWLALAAACVLAAVRFGPGLVREQAARMMPPAQAQEFGDHMLLALMETRGGLCDGAAGQSALARLGEAVAPGAPPRLRVLPLGTAPVAALPGGTVILDRAAVLDAVAAEEVAGWIAIGAARGPTAALLADAGVVAAARYLVTGDFGARALARAADAAATRPPTRDEASAALVRLADARIDPEPFAAALRRGGRLMPGAAVPAAVDAGPPLGAQEWAAVRRLCRG